MMPAAEAGINMLRPRRPTAMPARAASLIFVVVSLIVCAIGRGERSGWILMTSPTGADHAGNSLLGYCYLHGGQPFMKENIPHAAQVGLFCGSIDALRLSENREDFRLLRGLYSLLASIVAPIVGVIAGMLLLNWIAWAVCAAVAWRMTRDIFHSQWAALFAVVLVCGGMGTIVHIGDYSPHLLSFATYYTGIWLVFQSRVYRDRRPWRTHLGLGVYFAIACLAYNTGVMLVGVYLLTAMRRNRPWHLLLAAGVALTARPLWQAALGSRVVDLEADYLSRSLNAWREAWGHGGVYVAKTVGRSISEILLFFDSPAVILVGLACCLVVRLPAPLRWLGWAAMGIPVLASLVFTPVASARGYLVYGASLWIYVCLAGQLARGWTSRRRLLPWAAGLTIGIVIASHFAWSTAHLAGWLGPVKTYFLGWRHGSDYLLDPPTAAYSLTDQEPTPVLFGGDAALAQAGAYAGRLHHSLRADQVSLATALLARAWFFGYFALLALVLPPSTGQRMRSLTAVIVLYVASSAVAAWGFRQSPAFFNIDHAVALDAHQTLRYEVTIGRRFLAAARRSANDGDALILFVQGMPFSGAEHDSDVSVAFYAGGHALPVDAGKQGAFVVRGDALRQLLDRLTVVPELAVEITNHGPAPTRLAGWQRNDLPRRRCVYLETGRAAPSGPGVLPLLELRLVAPNGRIRVAGF